MADAPDPKLFDKRVAHRYVRKGRLDEKEWEKHLKSLPDLADQAVPVESDLDGDELDDDLDDEEPEEPAAGAETKPTP
ncbi:MAG TPA: hypothetical protein VFP65_18915 [Anaeromyxobacteraceae bacterium]|nr:hypothetical protein [Anaeromyxobacteraceae bacterium]